MSNRRARHAKQGAIHGVLVVDKPPGPTSHDVVAAARRHFGTRRVGHAGTLDPAATGVLVLLLGEATKLSAHLTRDKKSYLAEVAFGASTSTLDAEGTVTRRRELGPDWLSAAALEAAIEEERQRTAQMPPVVSAIKVDGKRAHARARGGEEFDMAPRDVVVHQARLLGWDQRRAQVELTVSKGYYVRAFARDLGDRLGVPAHLATLRRTRSGPFDLSTALPFPPPAGARPLSLVEVARECFPTVELTPTGLERALVGKLLTPDDFTPGRNATDHGLEGSAAEPARAETSLTTAVPPRRTEDDLVACLAQDRLVALAQWGGPGTLKIVRGIHDGGQLDLHAPGTVG